MALLCRIKEAKLNKIFNNFTRNYFQIHSPRNQNSPISISDYFHHFQFTNAPKLQHQAALRFRQGFLDSRVRFFAAPVQFIKKKPEVKELNRPRLNDEIKAEFVRLVSDDGHTVISMKEAQQRAKDLELDLVEVHKNGNPPVCKIMDYHREKYKQKVMMKEKAKIKSAGSLKTGFSKEVRFSAKSELKDIKMKIDGVKRLMERGYRVKCSVLPTDAEDIGALLSKVAALLEDVAFVETGPTIEKRQGFLIVRHIKFGTVRKGNKAKKDLASTNSEIQKESTSSSDSPVNSEEKTHAGETGMDNNDEEFVLESDDEVEDFDKLFDVSNDVKGTNISHDQQRRFDSRTGSTARNDSSTFMPSQAPNFTPDVRPPVQPENRYARKVPHNASAMRNPVRSPNNWSPPQPHLHPNVDPPGGPGRAGSESSSPRTFRQNENPQPSFDISNRGAGNFSPHPGHQMPPNNHASRSTGFGMFSGAKGSDAGSFEGNQQSIGRHSNLPRNSTVRGNMPPPTSKPDGAVAGDNKKFGIFSGGSSNSVPGRKG